REITNQWTTEGSDATTDWYALDFGTPRPISAVKLYCIADNNQLALPEEVRLEYYSEGAWQAVPGPSFRTFTGNTVNVLSFDTLTTSRLRLHFTRGSKPVGVTEIEVIEGHLKGSRE
ncbi:MAG TPA: hypothetical protein VD816_12375, partial [Ohtaekwangia sp.]|nr:hypothetical protein [Ohtaekwangia sp.]